MNPSNDALLLVALTAVASTISAGVFFAFARLLRGPTLADRVVALDLLALLVVGVICAYDIATEQVVLLDVATVLALVAFLGTVAFAQYLERRGPHA